jgi:hypothetical protein
VSFVLFVVSSFWLRPKAAPNGDKVSSPEEGKFVAFFRIAVETSGSPDMIVHIG